jgi:D-methionine transport system permease protein
VIDPTAPDFWAGLFQVLLVGTGQTLYMVGVSLLITILVGLPLGIVLVGTEPGGLFENLFGSRALGRVSTGCSTSSSTSAAVCRSSS